MKYTIPYYIISLLIISTWSWNIDIVVIVEKEDQKRFF